MWPTVKYGHIRISTNITQLKPISHALCAHLNELEELSNYSSPEVLRKLAPDVTEEIAKAVSERWPTKPFDNMMEIILTDIRDKCAAAQGEVKLLETIFRSVPVAVFTQHMYDHQQSFRRPRRQAAIIGMAVGLLFGAFNVYELYELSSEVGALNRNQ